MQKETSQQAESSERTEKYAISRFRNHQNTSYGNIWEILAKIGFKFAEY
jgi:hypothetical protein